LKKFYECIDQTEATELFLEVQSWILRNNRQLIQNTHNLLSGESGVDMVVFDRSLLGCGGFIQHAFWSKLIDERQKDHLLDKLCELEDYWSWMLGNFPTMVVHLDCDEEDNLHRLQSRNYRVPENPIRGIALDREKQDFLRKHTTVNLKDSVCTITDRALYVNINTSMCTVLEAVEMIDALVATVKKDDAFDVLEKLEACKINRGAIDVRFLFNKKN